ncbi:Chemotaxis protein methyltransferase [Dyadobacter sp. CECT 9623]|jgi:chemotaxis protein methyltransferase CheR|uniref:Chemotaxis protein methyltransferase n=1 Tax=Dyadobacter linearis TaxID=2823330 RepID=A0ABM8UNX7_9BACT|nr:CheR family methyltransferase [Dyadobacter sp. CECT 9623]CAG5069196.1 Chemotaxis protein methyltransferase [Dyadobacter sp. CECT 9623]
MNLLEYPDLEVLIMQIRNASGFDFSGYARPSLLRRASRYLTKNKLTLPQLISHLEPESDIVFDLMQEMTVNYSEMFRDPDFFIGVKSEVFTYLESYPGLRFWVAGCASGEEAFSLAILLKECGYLDRSLIYATDLNNKVLTAAREGVFTLSNVRTFSENYLLAHGQNSLSDYYHVSYNKAVISREIRKNIVFSLHDLTGDGVFNEFQFISCRNVMIYFTLELRQRVFRLLYESLSMLGFLCLGKRETLRYSGIEQNFRVVDTVLNIYQKIK